MKEGLTAQEQFDYDPDPDLDNPADEDTIDDMCECPSLTSKLVQMFGRGIIRRAYVENDINFLCHDFQSHKDIELETETIVIEFVNKTRLTLKVNDFGFISCDNPRMPHRDHTDG